VGDLEARCRTDEARRAMRGAAPVPGRARPAGEANVLRALDIWRARSATDEARKPMTTRNA